MANIQAHTFPGVYAQVIDQSFLPPQTSRFTGGLIGPANKGPVNVLTPTPTVKDFRRNFGTSLGDGFYLADAAALLTSLSDGIWILRVAHQYTPVSNVAASGSKGGYRIFTPKAAVFDPANHPNTTDLYVRITQNGLPSTVNVIVNDVGAGFIDLQNTGAALAANYTTADVAFSELADAANAAESVLYGYNYSNTNLTGTLTGTKSAFTATYSGSASDIQVGAVYKITQANKATTEEIRVASVIVDSPVIVNFETSDVAQFGYQALSLQDSYVNATVTPALTTGPTPVLYMQAASPGTWANGEDATTGLYVKVRPGSQAGTKKLEVYEDSALTETWDNLVPDPDDPQFYETIINGNSAAIVVSFVAPAAGAITGNPANSVNPWDLSLTSVSTPKSMPVGPINNGQAGGTHGSFANGFNGENLSDGDIIGSIDPSDDTLSGIKAFEDIDTVEVDILAAPGIQNGQISVGVMQEMARVANVINAVAIVDIPANLTGREAIDWHNGQGMFFNRGKLNTRNMAVYWNWWTGTDQWSTTAGATKVFPPTMGALRCFAATFDNFKPWFVAAGVNRGIIPEAVSVQFPKVSQDTLDAMQGNGQSVNPILLQRGQIMVFGERTLQRAESKLTVVHSNILIHYIIKNLSELARQFVFDPNDVELITQVTLAFTKFLDTVQNERGIEPQPNGYKLVIDDTNNTPDTRNRRELNVDLFVIPTDSVERIFINAIVRESGANLQSVTATQ